MKNWITILTLTYTSKAHLAKTLLESEGIEVIMKNELIAQVNNFHSSMGGVELLVKEKNYEKALRLLKDAGYKNESNETGNKFLHQFNKYTSKIPYFGKLVLELRLISFIVFIVIIIIGVILLITVLYGLGLKAYWLG